MRPVAVAGEQDDDASAAQLPAYPPKLQSGTVTVSHAAERLAISRHALRRLMKKHGIETA